MALLLLIIQAYYWVETKDKTLEEVDDLFGGKHSSVPDIEVVRQNKEAFDVQAVETEIARDSPIKYE